MDEQEFKRRTKQLALRVIKLVDALPKGSASQVIGKQLIRSATSVGANYRAACRAKSTADLISKLRIVEEEADESLYWMELIVEAELVDATKLKSIMSETNEILAMTVASIKTLLAKNPTANRK
ncbi:four helix bundle protein [Microcoleus sp. F6_B4]